VPSGQFHPTSSLVAPWDCSSSSVASSAWSRVPLPRHSAASSSRSSSAGGSHAKWTSVAQSASTVSSCPTSSTSSSHLKDFERFEEFGDALERELITAVREHAGREGYQFVGPVKLDLHLDPQLSVSTFAIESEMVEGEDRPERLARIS